MTELINFKTEARKLLDEVNTGVRMYNWPYEVEGNSFKERLNNLRQKIYAASGKNIRIR